MVFETDSISVSSVDDDLVLSGEVFPESDESIQAKIGALKTMVHIETLSSVDDVIHSYDERASTYDKDFSVETYKGPMYTAQAIAERFTSNREQVKILDVAAGTGKVGQVLHSLGFTQLDALDGSAEMLSVLKATGLYDRVFEELISRDHRTDIEDNTYDITCITGAFIPSHVPFTALEEMNRVTKPGGYIVISMRREFLKDADYVDMEPYLDEMESKGLWTRAETRVVPNFFYAKDGMLFVLQKNK